MGGPLVQLGPQGLRFPRGLELLLQPGIEVAVVHVAQPRHVQQLLEGGQDALARDRREELVEGGLHE